MSLPIERTIAELATGNYTRPNPKLVNLSNLTAAEAKLFEQTWTGIEVKLRRQIIEQLVELAEDNVELNFDSIFRYCLTDRDTVVRSQAIEGLWECEDVSLVSPLIERLNQDSSVEVQIAAATALGNFALLAEFNKIRSQYAAMVVQALLAAVGDQTRPVAVRCRALEAVAALSWPEVKDAIEQAYHSNNRELRASAIYAMGRNGDPAWLPILISELASADANMRGEAATACGELGEEEVTPYLAQLIDDTDANVALAAIEALGKVGGAEAKKRLQQLLAEPEETIKQAARGALAELETTEDPFSSRMGNP